MMLAVPEPPLPPLSSATVVDPFVIEASGVDVDDGLALAAPGVAALVAALVAVLAAVEDEEGFLVKGSKFWFASLLHWLLA